MNLSVELVLKDHPSWPPWKAEREAGRRYDAAVRTFIIATLDTMHRLRPEGKFGLVSHWSFDQFCVDSCALYILHLEALAPYR